DGLLCRATLLAPIMRSELPPHLRLCRLGIGDRMTHLVTPGQVNVVDIWKGIGQQLRPAPAFTVGEVAEISDQVRELIPMHLRAKDTIGGGSLSNGPFQIEIER